MQNIRYLKPKSLNEAKYLLEQYKGECNIISGGTDVLIHLKKKTLTANTFVSLADIPELDYIRYDGTFGFRIGARTTLAQVAGSPELSLHCRILVDAAGMVGTPSIRRQASLAGNICNAAPSADTAPSLLVLEAAVEMENSYGSRTVPIKDFFVGPGKTIRNGDELVKEIQIPLKPAHSGAVYIKDSRSKGADLAIVGVAVLAVVENDIFQDIRIALGAVAPTPIRAVAAEQALLGKKVDPELIAGAAAVAASESKPIDDVRSSSEYRRKMVSILVERAVAQAVDKSRTEEQ